MKEPMPLAVECFGFSCLKMLQGSLILQLKFGLVYVMVNLVSKSEFL
jgi:hypothetical protein